MRNLSRSRQQRVALRRIARRLRADDPELARLLSGRSRGALRPLRFTSVPVTGYVVLGVGLLTAGTTLGVGSAIWWGLVALAMAVFRHRLGEVSREVPPPGTHRRGRDAAGPLL